MPGSTVIPNRMRWQRSAGAATGVGAGVAPLPFGPQARRAEAMVRAGVREDEFIIRSLRIVPPVDGVATMVTVHHVPTGVACTYEGGAAREWEDGFVQDLRRGRYRQQAARSAGSAWVGGVAHPDVRWPAGLAA